MKEKDIQVKLDEAQVALNSTISQFNQLETQRQQIVEALSKLRVQAENQTGQVQAFTALLSPDTDREEDIIQERATQEKATKNPRVNKT